MTWPRFRRIGEPLIPPVAAEPARAPEPAFDRDALAAEIRRIEARQRDEVTAKALERELLPGVDIDAAHGER